MIQFLCEKKGLKVQMQYLRGTGGAGETTFRPINPAVCAERSASSLIIWLLRCHHWNA